MKRAHICIEFDVEIPILTPGLTDGQVEDHVHDMSLGDILDHACPLSSFTITDCIVEERD